MVLLGGAYEDLLIYLERNRILEAPQLEICDVAATPAEVVEVLASRLRAIEETG